jgi:hypothetical protein
MLIERKRQEDLVRIKETLVHLTKLVEELEVKDPHEIREGDKVHILTKGKIGSRGDIATITKVNRSRISRSCKGQFTYREAKNIRKV